VNRTCRRGKYRSFHYSSRGKTGETSGKKRRVIHPEKGREDIFPQERKDYQSQILRAEGGRKRKEKPDPLAPPGQRRGPVARKKQFSHAFPKKGMEWT